MTIFILSFILWAILHSLTADARVKAWVHRQLGERAHAGLYRLGYNLFALISILPVLWALWTQVPDTLLWRLPSPFDWLALFVQLVGLLGLLTALLQTDIWEFVGLRQAVNYFTGKEHLLPPPKLVTGGMYAFVRHPLYFFSLLILWPTPVMTLQTLILNVMATLYLWAGSRVEEKRLTAVFGDAYLHYKEQVPGLLPIKLPHV
ncbi:MAG: DUF1295 domain-containing protein [Anaerolineales bacterium]|nr:DUF1295 domain-containing protein [Anaerolineales bacterium]